MPVISGMKIIVLESILYEKYYEYDQIVIHWFNT